MKKLGLIGYPLTHSFSKRYFTEKFEREGIEGWEYDLYPLENILDLPKLLQDTSGLVGLNVTIPYKEKVLSYLHNLGDEAAAIGAVNCIKIENGQLYGYNTDAYGFENALIPFLDGIPVRALILGTGGAAKAVAFVLGRLGIEFQFVSRNLLGVIDPASLPDVIDPPSPPEGRALPSEIRNDSDVLISANDVQNSPPSGGLRGALTSGELKGAIMSGAITPSNPRALTPNPIKHINYQNLTKHIIQTHQLIINTTPVGMSPNINEMPPMDMQYISKNHFCYDLIYNPEQTLWLKTTATQGAKTLNGLSMLHGQAERAWAIWNNHTFGLTDKKA